MYTITLSDGTIIDDLEFDGKNYISRKSIDLHIFVNNLSPVKISDGISEKIYSHMNLSQFVEEIDDENVVYFLEFEDISDDILSQIKLRADIDYLAMINDVDLDED